MDGAVYIAQEIVFHTPSEHKIDGKNYPMEMQVIHVGKSKGDITKTLIISFLFEKKSGVYNKFIERLDFFNLPNPWDKFRELSKPLFLPDIFYNTNEDSPSSMPPFSFYTYQGSTTRPPCQEQTIHYVASEPIGTSGTVIELFKEALRIPDIQDPRGNIIVSDESIMHSNRACQPLNGREVFFYDHKRYNCPDFRPRKIQLDGNAEEPVQNGHYERKQTEATSYFFVEGGNPSGIPGAYVVNAAEALGNQNQN